MIYLPNPVYSNNCAYVYDKDTIRVYDSVPRNNSTISYTDYFINSQYLTRTGQTTFNQYSTLPTCLDYLDFTTNVGYSNDFYKILIMSIILIGSVWFLVKTLLRRFLYGRKLF